MAPKKVKKVAATKAVKKITNVRTPASCTALVLLKGDGADDVSESSRRRLKRRDSDEQVERLVERRLSELTATEISGDKSFRLRYKSFLIIC